MMRHIAFATLVAAAVSASFEVRADCAENWFIGTWRASEHQTLTIRPSSDGIVWVYERLTGVKSDRWGDKVPASAEGKIVKTDGCRALLQGTYTRFENIGKRVSAVGTPMEWKFLSTSSTDVSSEGLGFGKETFRVRWRRDP